MRTVQPCTMIGAYGFDPDRVPRDEFQIRMAALNGVMDRKGLKAMLIYGDACEHSALAYFTSFIPRHRWALALLPRASDARLLVSMSSRDMPAQRLMTWIPEVMTAWTWDQGFDQWLASLGANAAADIGTLRFDLMRPVLREQIEKSIGNRFRLIAADPDVAALRTTRPRELSLVRDACEVVRASAEAFAQAWHAGEGAETAALAGERTARRLAAQDVRTLVSFDRGRSLAPLRGTFEPRTPAAALLGYIAVKHRGYWAEAFLTETDGPSDMHTRAQAGLEAALRLAAPGARACDIHSQATRALGTSAPHPALGASVGRRIGLSANEGGEVNADTSHVLAVGEVYALHVGARDAQGGAIASAVVAITAQGCEVLVRSP